MLFESERLLFSEFHKEDASTFYELNNDPVVMQYTGDEAFESVEAAKEFILAYDAYEKSGFGRWTVKLKSTNEAIGWCGLKQHPDGMVDLGYRILRKHWNKGYATEAAKASLNFGFNSLNIKEIVGRTARANLASIRVLEKIGMTYWKDAPCEGIVDSIYYRISV